MRILPPFLFNLTWLIDTFLVKLFGKEEDDWTLHDGIWTLMIVWWIVAWVIALIILPWVTKEAFSLSYKALLFLIIAGLSYGMAAFPYFKALQNEQIENITPMYQIVPVFTYLLGIVFLREIIPFPILLCILWIVIITSLFYVDFGTFHINKKALVLCSISALLYAISYVFFKVWWLAEWNFRVALFREHIGVFLVGLYFFFFRRTRRSTLKYFKTSWRKFSLLNLVNELFFIWWVISVNYLWFSHYVVYVWILSNAIQPMMAFPMKYLAYRIKPEWYEWNYSKKQLLVKAILVLVLLIGVWYISLHIGI